MSGVNFAEVSPGHRPCQPCRPFHRSQIRASGRRVQGQRKPIAPATPLGVLDAVTGSERIEPEKDSGDTAPDCVRE